MEKEQVLHKRKNPNFKRTFEKAFCLINSQGDTKYSCNHDSVSLMMYLIQPPRCYDFFALWMKRIQLTTSSTDDPGKRTHTVRTATADSNLALAGKVKPKHTEFHSYLLHQQIRTGICDGNGVICNS